MAGVQLSYLNHHVIITLAYLARVSVLIIPNGYYIFKIRCIFRDLIADVYYMYIYIYIPSYMPIYQA